MADKANSSADVKTEEKQTPPAEQGVKTEIPSPPTEGVKPDGTEDKLEMVTWKNYGKIPKDLYTEIKNNTEKETERKLHDHYKPLIKTEEDTKMIDLYKKLMQSIAPVVKPGKQWKPGDEISFDEIQLAMQNMNEAERKALETKLQNTETKMQEIKAETDKKITQAKEREIKQSIMTELLSHEKFRTEAIQEAVDLILLTNVLRCDDDLETIFCVDPKTNEKLFDSKTGDLIQPKIFIYNWLESKPLFQKASEKSGAGADYQDGKSHPLQKLMGTGYKPPFTITRTHQQRVVQEVRTTK